MQSNLNLFQKKIKKINKEFLKQKNLNQKHQKKKLIIKQMNNYDFKKI